MIRRRGPFISTPPPVHAVLVIHSILLLLIFALPAFTDEQAQIDFANGLFARGFFQEAADEYRAYLKAYPQGQYRAAALYRLGESEHAAGRHEQAVETFDQVLGDPKGADFAQRARLRRGVALFQLKRFDDALKSLQTASNKDYPAELRAEALYYLGKLHFEAGRPAEAVAAFKRLADETPESPLVPYGHYQRAFVHLARNEYEDAAVAFSAVAADSRADADLRMECRFRAAETYDKLGWFEAAVKAYEQLRNEFPGSDYARRAVYGYAWALYHAGRYGDATRVAADFAAQFPDSSLRPGIEYLRGNCLQQQKQYNEALAVYAALRERFPESEFVARARHKTAWALYLAGRKNEAEYEALALMRETPDAPAAGDTAFLLGTLYHEKGEYATALERFRLVVERFPSSEFAADALYKSGECLAQLGQTEEAASVFERFAAAHPKHPLAGEAVLRAGDADFFSGDFAKSVEKYKRILETVSPGPVEEATLYRLAIARHNLQDYAGSAETFGALLEKYPDGPHAAEARLRIGDHLLRDLKKPLEAIDHYQAAYDKDRKGPFAGGALNGLALARYETKDYDGAAELFARVIREFPDIKLNRETYEWTGQHLLDRHEFDDAVVAFRALLRHTPDYPNPERVLFQIAEALEQSAKTDEALRQYQAVADRAPQSALAVEARFRMAGIYEVKKDFDKAIPLYESAANANTGDTAARARFRLGELFEAKGDYGAAAKSYMRVAILFFHEELSPESLLRAARCFEKNNERDQAVKTYREVLDEYPNSPQAALARERLDALAAS